MKWISVKDKLPDLEKDVLTWDGDEIYICAKTDVKSGSMSYIINGWRYQICTCCDSTYTRKITHWMPLPEKPNEEQ